MSTDRDVAAADDRSGKGTLPKLCTAAAPCTAGNAEKICITVIV